MINTTTSDEVFARLDLPFIEDAGEDLNFLPDKPLLPVAELLMLFPFPAVFFFDFTADADLFAGAFDFAVVFFFAIFLFHMPALGAGLLF